MSAFLGLDISKETIDACLIDERGNESAKKVSNNSKGFVQLKNWLKNRRVREVHVCMEATGTYYEAVAESFADDCYLVSVVNPAQIKAFATSLLSRAKTDAVDARLIAQYCQLHVPEPWQPLSPVQRKLRSLVRFRDNLKQTRASYEVQRQTPNIEKAVARSIDELIDSLDEQIRNVEAEIQHLIDNDPDLRQGRKLLTSIEGIADTTAATILGEAPNLSEFRDAKAVSAFAGLSSRIRQSGTSVRGSGGICKTGNARLRRSLYLPAIVALRWNPVIRALGDRLRAAGKPKKKIIVAAMRKLLVLAYGVLKSGVPFYGALTPS